MNKQEHEALRLCVESLDQLLPYLAKVPVDVGLLNDALMAARPLLKQEPAPAQTEQQSRHYDELKAARALIRDFRRAVNTSDVATPTAAARTALCSCRDRADEILSAPIAQAGPQPERWSGKFAIGDRVKKTGGSEWVGHVCGTYSTALTPEGYAVESEAHAGSVQIYPDKALEAAPKE